eukprot:TRINITY_DN67973_c6_g2_i2.p1 TRINITY_DN67973_c6_g2~~TRINITY_DN67973_c6_g2_i2.p1  ORF type:complete len:383 (+),score=9.62 TRINITY_DN67973_c6_g2_i2:34-1149(+)
MSAPIIIVPGLYSHGTLPALASLIAVEGLLSPLAIAWKRKYFKKLKSNLPAALVGAGAGTLAGSSVVSLGVGHFHTWHSVSAVSTSFPEGIIFSLGTTATALLYYWFTHQVTTTVESEFPIEYQAWAPKLRTLADLATAGIVIVALVPASTSSALHFLASNTFFLGGSVFQLLLTHAQTKAAETKPELVPTETLDLRNVLNCVMLAGGPAGCLLNGIGQGGLAYGMQCASSLSWIGFLATFVNEFKQLPHDASKQLATFEQAFVQDSAEVWRPAVALLDTGNHGPTMMKRSYAEAHGLWKEGNATKTTEVVGVAGIPMSCPVIPVTFRLKVQVLNVEVALCTGEKSWDLLVSHQNLQTMLSEGYVLTCNLE